MNVRKILVVASTEFGTAVRTKSFLVGLLLLPIIMGASILIQAYVAKHVDTTPRTFAVIDRTGGRLYDAIAEAAAANNEHLIDPETGKPRGARFEPERVDFTGVDPEQRKLELSDRIRSGSLYAIVDIPANVFEPGGGELSYYSDNPNDSQLRGWLTGVVGDVVRGQRFKAAGIDQSIASRLNLPITVDNLGLVDRGGATGATGPDTVAGGAPGIRKAEKVDPIRTFAVPAAMLFITFFVIMSSAPHLLNSVLEEKMSRVSEVLLGSVTPFELMMGKLLGNVGIATLLAFLYVGGALGVAAYNGYGNVVTPELLAILALFMVLAVLLYGSLYMAVGAACSELKDAQSLMMPVMLLSMLPMFVWTAIVQNPASPLSVGMSLFPPATPFLMPMRMVLRPSAPPWQVALGIVLTLLTVVACVAAAGKIFRTGLLMHGKAPTFRELARWVMAR
jgi:ABC-type Na+ efflux pump permease subunit